MAAAAVTAGLSGGIVVLTATPALAAPCSAWRNWTYTWAASSSCSFEPGWQHQAWAKCDYKYGSQTKTDTFYGSWVGTTSTSTAICPASTVKFVSYGVNQGY